MTLIQVPASSWLLIYQLHLANAACPAAMMLKCYLKHWNHHVG